MVAGQLTPEIEFGVDLTQSSSRARNLTFLLVPMLGLIDRTEISAELPFVHSFRSNDEDPTSLDDITLIGKILVSPESDVTPNIVLKGAVKTPSGNQHNGIGSGDWDYAVSGVMSKLSGNIFVHAEAGYTFVGEDFDPTLKDNYFYGLAVDLGLTPAWHILGEVTGQRNPRSSAGGHIIRGLFGAAFRISDLLRLDAAARTGITPPAEDWGVTVGLTLSFDGRVP